jgi:hypothetical protein
MPAISPNEVVAQKQKNIPEIVFEAFNELIADNFTEGSAKVKQEDVINLILSKSGFLSRQEIFDKGWLNIEDVYRGQGWKVEYDKPGCYETYSAFFKFKAKK